MLEHVQVLEDKEVDGFKVIKFKEGTFKDVEFTYGSIKFNEDENKENCTLNFDYNVISGKVEESDVEFFEKTIGDMLIQMLEEQIAREEVVYHGGV